MHAAADAKDLAPCRRITLQLLPEAPGLEGGQIPQGLFAARHDHGVGLAQGFAGLDPAQLNAGFRFQGVQVREVAQRGQPQYGDLQFGGAFAAAALQQIQGIFWRKELVEPGHHPQHRNAGFLLQPAAALIKEFPPAPEAVDQDPFDQRSLHRAEQGQGAHDLGKDAPALDIGHQ